MQRAAPCGYPFQVGDPGQDARSARGFLGLVLRLVSGKPAAHLTAAGARLVYLGVLGAQPGMVEAQAAKVLAHGGQAGDPLIAAAAQVPDGVARLGGLGKGLRHLGDSVGLAGVVSPGDRVD